MHTQRRDAELVCILTEYTALTPRQALHLLPLARAAIERKVARVDYDALVRDGDYATFVGTLDVRALARRTDLEERQVHAGLRSILPSVLASLETGRTPPS